jgi:hypothetical protein
MPHGRKHIGHAAGFDVREGKPLLAATDRFLGIVVNPLPAQTIRFMSS